MGNYKITPLIVPCWLYTTEHVIIYITRLFQCEDWFQYDQQTSHFTHCTDHVSLNLLEIVFDKPYQIFIFSQCFLFHLKRSSCSRDNFWNNSDKLGQIIYIYIYKGIFLNLFHDLKSNWSLVPHPFFITLSIKRCWVRKKN